MKVGIVGVGNVGATTAFLLATSGIADEVVLVNRSLGRSYVEALDIAHAMPMMSSCVVKCGDYGDLADANVVVMACGCRRKVPIKNRLDLLGDNIHMCAEMADKISCYAPDTIMVIVTNPVDVLGKIAMEVSKFPRGRVISSGTILDSARFTTIIAEHFSVSVESVRADVFGEHGDSQVPIWSGVKICGIPVGDFAKGKGVEFSSAVKSAIGEKTKSVANEIVDGKSATYYGIAGAVFRICKAIRENSDTVLNVSTLHEDFEDAGDVFLSTPTVVGTGGAAKILPPIIDQSEREALVRSAMVISEHSELALKILD
ncbi:MAG: hypothetical protein LBR91_02235 [Puniceicoccales bacterium]|jgi:L-lactate dehydrogenase|nr:hypothetical protein [Puniceicoccales bacterium]